MKKIIAALAATAALFVATPTAHADFLFDVCPAGDAGVVTGTPTSCLFAYNVRASYYTQRTRFVLAYSPVTNQVYTMDCGYPNFIANFVGGGQRIGVLCAGGNNAQVVIW